MQGVLRIPDWPTTGMSILRLDVHTARPPSDAPLHMQIATNRATTQFSLSPGWRRLMLLNAPQSEWQSYDRIVYHLQGTLLSSKRDLGMAVAQISVTPTTTHGSDWQRFLYLLLLWVWVIPLGAVRRWSPRYALGVFVGVSVIWATFHQQLAYLLPNHWVIVGYLWTFSAIFFLAPLRHPRLSYAATMVCIAVAVGLWQIGFGWLGVGVLVLEWMFAKPWPDVAWPDTATFGGKHWGAILLVLAVLTAVGLRFVQLDDLPTGLFRDEARHGGQALRILAGERMVYSPVANLPAGYFYLSALPISWFGESAWSIRVVAALAGTMSVALLYVMFKPLLQAPIALWSSVVLATLLWHVGLSRIGFPATLGPLLTIFATGAWYRTFNSSRPLMWSSVAGVATGFMLMVYHSARLMPLVVVLTIVVLALQHRWSVRRVLLPFALFVMVAGVVASPILWYAITQPDNYMRRIGVTSIMADAAIRGLPVWLAVFDNVHAYVGMLFVAGDTNPRHYNLGAPQLYAVDALAFVVGVIWMQQLRTVWRWWLYGWLGIGLLSGILSVDAPHALRTVEATVPVAIITGVGFYRMTSIARPLMQLMLVLLVLSGSATWSSSQYLFWQRDPRTQSRFDTDATNDVRFVHQLMQRPRPRDAYVYVPMQLRASDVGIYFLHRTAVRVLDDELPQFNPAQQHIVLRAVDAPPLPYATLLPWLPKDMQQRYQIWCIGDCQNLDWGRRP